MLVATSKLIFDAERVLCVQIGRHTDGEVDIKILFDTGQEVCAEDKAAQEVLDYFTSVSSLASKSTGTIAATADMSK